MDKSEMKEWLHVKDYPSVEEDDNKHIHIPNEIFADFNNASFKTWKHKGFAYAYYYICDFIYYSALYGKGDIQSYSQESIISKLIGRKSIVSYITKKGGLLEEIGYLKTTKDFPIYYYNDSSVKEIDFGYYSELSKEVKDTLYKVGNRFMAKEPIKSLTRYDGEDFTGTYYNKENTHSMSVQRFIDILTHPRLGYTGVYIYAYLVMKCNHFKNEYQVSNENLAKVIGCNKDTITSYTKQLEALGFIASKRKSHLNHNLEKIYSVIDKIDEYKKKRIKPNKV